MGFDCYGKQPATETGEYFRNSVWGWRPLWDYVAETCGDIIGENKIEHGCYNDGQLITADEAQQMADRLRDRITSGHAQRWALDRDLALKALPDDPCNYCEDGITTKAIAKEYPAYQEQVGKTCIQCHGKGSVRPFATHYRFSVENVREFAEFCEQSGGFEIC